MCTLVILLRPGHEWPLILAANRDEQAGRAWRAPGRHWADRPQVVAGMDELGEGSWLGMNDYGLVAGVMNRAGSLGPAPGKRSRGELVLEALDHAEARAAAEALADLNPAAYRPFNLFAGDVHGAFWLRNTGSRADDGVEVYPLPAGLSMLTAHDLNDPQSPRIRAYLPRFRAAPVPDPEAGDWDAWTALLASRLHDEREGPTAAMNVETDTGLRTLSSALIALPAPGRAGVKPVWRFAPGPPHRTTFEPVEL